MYECINVYNVYTVVPLHPLKEHSIYKQTTFFFIFTRFTHAQKKKMAAAGDGLCDGLSRADIVSQAHGTEARPTKFEIASEERDLGEHEVRISIWIIKCVF